MRCNMLRRLLLTAFLCAFVSVAGFAQTSSLEGTVVDSESGEPLPGANVYIEELETGDSADENGEFSITNIEDGTYNVTISYVGYQEMTTEIEVQGTTREEIELQADSEQLDEVVVTGYGTRDRSAPTGAISNVSGEDFENRSIQTADQALQGTSSGFRMVSTSGQPGGDSYIRIRGMGSINAGGDPLYIVDGVRMENSNRGGQASNNILSSINPGDIENIEVLKDAEATAIYGSDGANGVVLVTTKQGAEGETQFSLDYKTGVAEQTFEYDMLSGPEFVEMMIESETNRYQDLGETEYDDTEYDSPEEAARQDAIDTFGDPDEVNTYDWYGELLQPGAQHQFDLSARGGGENTQFYISGSFDDQDGTVINSNFNRMGLRANINHQATDRLSFDLKTNLSRTKATGQVDQQGFQGGSNFINSPFHGGVTTRVTSPIYNDDGTYNEDTGDLVGVLYNNVQVLNEVDQWQRQNQLVGSLSATYEITDNLNFRSRANLDYRLQRDHDLEPNSVGRFANLDGGSVYDRTRESTSMNTDHVLDYQNNFNDVHNLNVLLGAEYQDVYQESHSALGEELPNALFGTIDATASNGSMTGSFSEYKKAGIFTRGEYTYDDRYTLSTNLRYDGSSRFGQDSRYGLFYSGGIAWDMAAEDFMQDVDFVEELKPRISYGTTGNSDIGNYTNRTFFGAAGSYGGATGLRPTQLGISSLTWEVSRSLDFAVDWSMFEDRLYGTFELFRKDNEELLLDRSLPNHSGFSGVQDNIGEVRNQGFEVEVGGVLVDAGDFSWATDFNITYEESEILSLAEGQENIGTTVRVGEPREIFWGADFAGVNPADGRPMWYAEDGSLTYEVTEDDREPIGSPMPDYYGGFNNSFNYGPLSLDVLFHYEYGKELYAVQYDIFMMQPHRGRVLTEEIYDRWQEPGDMTHVPRAYSESAFPGSSNYWEFDDRNMQDGSFIRLKNLNLQYQLPSDLMESWGLNAASVFVQGENLLTWTAFEGPDPEVPAQAQTIYPKPRTITGGVSIDF